MIGAHTSDVCDAAAEKARTHTSSIDLFSLSRIFERSGAAELSLSTCRRALEAGLPETIETQALWQLAAQHKRRREHERAVELWLEVTRREAQFALRAFEELAMYYEHRARDANTALEFAERALKFLGASPAVADFGVAPLSDDVKRFSHRLARLRKKIGQEQKQFAV